MIAVVDYGMGNLRSVEKALNRIGCNAKITSDKDEILNADKLIMPGVGHFRKGMENLNKMDLMDPLNKAVNEKKIPFLGICLGMQLMTNFSEEGNCRGLGWIDTEVSKFKFEKESGLKVPHIGWNTVKIIRESIFFTAADLGHEYYFVHSYYIGNSGNADSIGTTFYGLEFVSCFQKGNIYGVQFHPEKSLKSGLSLIMNFIQKS